MVLSISTPIDVIIILRAAPRAAPEIDARSKGDCCVIDDYVGVACVLAGLELPCEVLLVVVRLRVEGCPL